MHFNIYNKKNSEGYLSVITTTRYAFTVHTYIYQKKFDREPSLNVYKFTKSKQRVTPMSNSLQIYIQYSHKLI